MLDQFRVDSRARPVEVEEPKVVFEGRLLAFDQSLSDTGYALLHCRGSEIYVMFTGNVRTDKVAKGHEDTLRRAEILYREFIRVISELNASPLQAIAHELPAVGPKMMRPESSLVAATALRLASLPLGLPVFMIGAQTVKKTLTGRANTDKKSVREAVKKMFPSLPRPTNEAVYDAIGVGVTAARR